MPELHGLDYNTQTEQLIFREYGRNVQRLVDYAKTVEDRDERNVVIKAIIGLMGQMHPHLRNVEEFKHKLWDHIYTLAEFDIDIDSPYPVPTREELFRKPDPINYPQEPIKFRHYGKNVENLIEKAIAMEDEEKKMAFAKVIGNYMKMVYINWNRDHVNDEQIKNDLLFLSGGKLDLSAESVLEVPKQNRKRKRIKVSGTKGGKNYSSNGKYGNGKNGKGYKKRNHRY